MRSLILTLLALACASHVQAALNYITYDLNTGQVTPVATETLNVTDVAYRNGSTLLMVQDTSLSTEAYIGVFEVTNAQAQALQWSASKTEGDTTAYAYKYTATSALPSFPLTNHPYLSLPTESEWTAYAGELRPSSEPSELTTATPIGYNIGSVALPDYNYLYRTPEQWIEHTAWPWQGIASAAHGTYDMYGNVLEATREGTYIGGCTAVDVQQPKCTLTDTLLTPALPLVTTDTTHRNIMVNGYVGARLVYRPMTSFTVTIARNGTPIETLPGKREGDTITFTPPAAPEGMALYGIETSPQGLLEGEDDHTFTMPASAVTINYIYKPCVYLNVTGATASATRCALGEESVTLTPVIPNRYSAFEAWTYDASLQSMVAIDPESHVLTFTPTTALTPGATVSFTATTSRYPRVLVYGGTATLTHGEAKGEGYYTPGSTLTLSAPAVNGYSVEWRRTQGDLTTVTGATLTVREMNAELEIYTATYTPAAINTVDTTLPAIDADNLAFGYSTTPKTVNLAGNRYTFTALQAADNVVFNLEDNTCATNLTALPIGEANTLTFLRVDPKTIDKDLNTQISPFFYMSTVPSTHRSIQATYHTLEPYYLAASEFTQGQYNKLNAIVEEGPNPLAQTPYNTSTQATALEVIARLRATLHNTIALPTQYECEAAALIGYTKDHQTSGQYPQARVAYNGGASNIQIPFGQPVTTSGQTLGGFYGLIGNYGEWTASDATYAYSGGYDSITNEPVLDRFMTLFIQSTPASLTFRPKIPSPRPETVTLTLKIGDASADITLPKGATFDLGAPALPGQAFVGWCINEATTPETSTTFTATDDATFTALYQPMALITLTYEGCSGAPTLPPGGQTYLYPTDDRPIRSWRVCINGTERPDCLQDGLLTLPPDAQTVTVTALPNAPGYLMRFAERGSRAAKRMIFAPADVSSLSKAKRFHHVAVPTWLHLKRRSYETRFQRMKPSFGG